MRSPPFVFFFSFLTLSFLAFFPNRSTVLAPAAREETRARMLCSACAPYFCETGTTRYDDNIRGAGQEVKEAREGRELAPRSECVLSIVRVADWLANHCRVADEMNEIFLRMPICNGVENNTLYRRHGVNGVPFPTIRWQLGVKLPSRQLSCGFKVDCKNPLQNWKIV